MFAQCQRAVCPSDDSLQRSTTWHMRMHKTPWSSMLSYQRKPAISQFMSKAPARSGASYRPNKTLRDKEWIVYFSLMSAPFPLRETLP
mmetsp:Transcript_25382/g.52382  ORF Transcript_25382/g.52382 Transcript_25382/m.52382 type:complete len:88 (+) Transcript_25382:148-411(+)